MELEIEVEYFESQKRRLLEQHPGLFVVVKGTALQGAYADAGSAYRAGFERFGLNPFLVRRVIDESEGEHLQAA